MHLPRGSEQIVQRSKIKNILCHGKRLSVLVKCDRRGNRHGGIHCLQIPSHILARLDLHAAHALLLAAVARAVVIACDVRVAAVLARLLGARGAASLSLPAVLLLARSSARLVAHLGDLFFLQMFKLIGIQCTELFLGQSQLISFGGKIVCFFSESSKYCEVHFYSQDMK